MIETVMALVLAALLLQVFVMGSVVRLHDKVDQLFLEQEPEQKIPEPVQKNSQRTMI